LNFAGGAGIVAIMAKHLVIFQAIAQRKKMRATYNRVAMTLAPHILYTRHDDMHLDAVALEKDGRIPREKKLGTFKVLGLSEMSLCEEGFEVEEVYEPEAEKYAGVTLFAVE
jgi:hypothetical protein